MGALGGWGDCISSVNENYTTVSEVFSVNMHIIIQVALLASLSSATAP